ncbi:MAG: DUF2511 domain-containing protein [Mycolicibacterium sp.]|nr:DUF2511 domain-containing protein [Mycolicibacterium sp.]
MPFKQLLTFTTASVITALTACTPSTTTAPETSDIAAAMPSESAAVAGAPSGNRPKGYVSEGTWTDGPWPLTVPDATLMCAGWGTGGQKSVTLAADGKMYAVNGTAKSTKQFEDLDAIWADDSTAPGLKVNIGPLLTKGLSLCD